MNAFNFVQSGILVFGKVNPFPNDKFETRPNSKALQTTILSLTKMAESNFSFSRSVFKRLVLQTRKNQGLFGKGLNALMIYISQYFIDEYH